MTQQTTIEINGKKYSLEQGKNYSVIHTGSKRATRRIFKGVEQGILDIPFLVFTTKVNKEATATQRTEGECIITRYHDLKGSLPNEIVIPYYDIKKITF